MVPVVTQPMGSITAEAGLSPTACTGTAAGDVVVESVGTHPGYNTAEYAQIRADKLAVRNKGNLSAEVMLNYVKQLVNYLYSFTKILASPDPLEGDEFLTPALDKISLQAGMIKGSWLKGWMEENVMKLSPEAIVTKLDGVTKTDTFFILKKFLNVLDNSGQLMARLPHGIFQPCLKFVGSNDEPRLIGDAYVMASSKRYNEALNVLVGHVQKPHVPLLGNNPINSLLKGLKAENRVANPGSKGDRYPTSMDLLNLCRFPLPAQYQAEENQGLK